MLTNRSAAISHVWTKKTISYQFYYASALNEFLMLGNVATQFESRLEFNIGALSIVNNPEADARLKFEPRPGWTI